MNNRKFGFTMAGAGQRTGKREGTCVKREGFNKGNKPARSAHKGRFTLHTSPLTLIAFTMAEILLSLTIIGVVAAITLPSLTGNINERTWNTQRKALYSRISQAIALMPALNGFGTLDATTDNAAETFITSGLAKVLKINNICSTNYADCGIVTSYTDMRGTKKSIPTTLYSLDSHFSYIAYCGVSYSVPNTTAVAFETQNSESIIAYYNRNCRTEYLNSTQSGGNVDVGFAETTMCVNFIYDLNGKKGPNTVGKDIGVITVFNATDSITVAPVPTSSSNAGGATAVYKWENAVKACTNEDSESRLPNIDEASSMLINKELFNLTTPAGFWSATVADSTHAWSIGMDDGNRSADIKSLNTLAARCIKR